MKKVLGILVILGLALVGYIATRPATFHIERSATTSASPEVVFANIDDFHHWGAWSPWENLDPQMKKTYQGPESGVGSQYHWVGNDKVGEGNMTIVDSKPNELVGIKLEFLKPFASTCTARFALAPETAGTRVTWSMDGTNNFMAKTMGLFMNMDKMIGNDFEKGLASLKTVSEASAEPAPAGSDTTAAPPTTTH